MLTDRRYADVTFQPYIDSLNGNPSIPFPEMTPIGFFLCMHDARILSEAQK